MYKEQARSLRFHALKTLMDLKYSYNTSVSPHVMKMMDLIGDLAKLGFELQPDIILGSLSGDSRGFIQNFNMHNLVKSNGELHGMLKIEETNFTGGSHEVLIVKGPKTFKRTFKGKRIVKGIFVRPSTGRLEKQRLVPCFRTRVHLEDICHHCGGKGHWRRNYEGYATSKMKIGFPGPAA